MAKQTRVEVSGSRKPRTGFDVVLTLDETSAKMLTSLLEEIAGNGPMREVINATSSALRVGLGATANNLSPTFMGWRFRQNDFPYVEVDPDYLPEV